MAPRNHTFKLTAAALFAGCAGAGAVHAQDLGASGSEGFIFGEPLDTDALASSLGLLERNGQTVNLGLGSSALTRIAYPKLPSAPELSGVSGGDSAAVKVVMNDVVPQIVTNLLGTDAPTSTTSTGAAPLIVGLSFLPTPGRP